MGECAHVDARERRSQRQDGAIRYAYVDRCVQSETGAGPMQSLTATLPTVVAFARLVKDQDQAHKSDMGNLG
jgi:hypothetical protein